MTVADLTYRDHHTLVPNAKRAGPGFVHPVKPQFAEAAGLPFVTIGLNDMHLMPAPAGGVAVSEYYIYNLVIKSPRKDEHFIPDQLMHLAPLIQKIADHEKAFGPPMYGSATLMTLRSIVLRPGESEGPTFWHMPKPLSPEQVRNNMLLFNASSSAEFWARRLDPSFLTGEYMISDAPTIKVQSSFARASWRNDASETREAFILRDPSFTHRTVNADEIVRGTNCSFRAYIPANEALTGTTRTTVHISYIPVL